MNEVWSQFKRMLWKKAKIHANLSGETDADPYESMPPMDADAYYEWAEFAVTQYRKPIERGMSLDAQFGVIPK